MNKTTFDNLLAMETQGVSNKFHSFNAPEEVKNILTLLMVNSIKDSLKRLILEPVSNRDMLLTILNSEQAFLEILILNVLETYQQKIQSSSKDQ